MQRNNLFQICNLLALIAIITITTIGTTAQIATKPKFNINPGTSRHTYSLTSFTVQVQPEASDQKFVLSISNPFGEHLKITVTGDTSPGFIDTTSELTWQKRINMAGAEDGTYTLTVSSDQKTFTKTITLTSTDYNRNLTLQ